MHFGTTNEVLDFIKEHAIEGTIVKDPYQERISKTAFKYMGENYGEAITYIHGMIEDSSEKMLAASKALKVNANTLIKFYERPVFSCSSYSRSYCREFGKSRKGGEGNWLIKMNLKS